MDKYENRSSVPEKYKWNLKDYFKSNEEFKKELKIVNEKVNEISKFVGCTKEPEKLYEYLENDVLVGSRIMDLAVYAMTLMDSDLSESEPQEFVGQCDELESKYAVNNAFFEPELLSLEEKEYNDLFKYDKLKKYKAYLDNIYRYKKHVLTEEEEKIVSTLIQSLGSYGQMSSTLLNSCNDYGTVIMDDGTCEKLMSTNYNIIMKKLSREKRREVYEQFNKVRDQYASISASLLNNYVKTKNNLSQIYKFNSAFEQKLFSQKLTNKVFDSLVDACVERKNVLKKYYDIKARILGVDELMPWDAPIDLYKIDKEYTIEEAQNIIIEALKPLGEDYIERFKTLITDRAVDYCQYKGKQSGGYNVSTIGKRSSKILMSFNGDLDGVSTLAHEGGHYTHHTYMYDFNEPIYREHSSMVCEVASLTNECLLSSYLVNNGTKEEAMAGLANIIGVIISNLFGAVQEGDLEREFYDYSLNGGVLTKEYLYNLTEQSIKKFYPVEKLKHEYQKLSWVSRSHYYMFFYLFSYAICISVATNVAKEILNGNKEMLDNYHAFLKCGNDTSISDTFKILNIDLEDKNVYLNAIDYLDHLLSEFINLYEEVKDGDR